MGINVQLKWKLKVDGKEYGSVEEMPANIREAYQRAKGTSRIAATRIIFNGQEYESVEAMPPDVRQVYDGVMKAAETGKIPADVLSGLRIGTTTRVQASKDVSGSIKTPRPIEPESILSLSPRMLIIGLALLTLLITLYFITVR